jgi:serine/threonine protein kinase
LNENHQRSESLRPDTPVLDREKDDSLPHLTSSEIALNQLIEERFKVLSLLGEGGMGYVYLVEEVLSGKRFALKTISATEASKRTLQRFNLEAKATSLLDHPNLIRVHDFGLINGQQPYFVMDYCQGQTLAQLIKAKGPLSEKEALDVFIVICNALAYAHVQGVVHRDLKPSNIMLTSSLPGVKSQIKVLDFGIAKVFRDEAAFNTLTRTGEIVGSPLYMSPEQCMGREIDSRSDIYSLGCVFFECLTGAPPFLGDSSLATMLKHQSDQPASMKEASLRREFSSDLEQVVAQMLAKDPAKRYQNLLRVADNLRSVKKGEPLVSGESRSKRKSVHAKVISASIAAIVAMIWVMFAGMVESPTKIHHTTSVPWNRAGLDLPALEAVIKPSASKNLEFFSDPKPLDKDHRKFHFPAKSIGFCGYSEADSAPAVGERIMRVPFAFEVTDKTSVLSGFRDDEVRSLKMRGLMVEDSATRYIKNWRELRTMDIGESEISDKSIVNLKGLTGLRELCVAGSNITGPGLRPLEHVLAQVNHLNVAHIPLANQILPILVDSKQLNYLRMASTGLVDDDLKTISKIPNITVLDVRENPISDKGIEQLCKLKHLHYLRISLTHATVRCIETIKKMPQLQSIDVSTGSWTPEDKTLFVSLLEKQHCTLEKNSN